ncbi:peptide-methionine (S)-S-oxide reductase MsrA [Rhizosaccharibacter radicis]|uniref:Peptide methionine sulfoxide reductase MsrA n=1 Tax=Rhizosaccharibacter radicis TaxID=2782605 RepID=A0ABT1VWS4_9PROT|nr:peptide-methionine (S)-S-oxide reductase MsrA [Acetobacteraceae bacterium KSS12]
MADDISTKSPRVALLGGGCFWCVEAVFADLRGVSGVKSGYAGGTVPHPSYEAVCTGRTGHAEVVRIEYDPSVLSYADLLRVFFATHDPTTLNRQGADVGTQYRSVIFVNDDEERRIAEDVRDEIQNAGIWDGPLMTEISQVPEFYPAEAYHDDYFALHPEAGYCRAVIAPKVVKFRKQFSERLKRPTAAA